jgi:hypothetical protein
MKSGELQLEAEEMKGKMKGNQNTAQGASPFRRTAESLAGAAPQTFKQGSQFGDVRLIWSISAIYHFWYIPFLLYTISAGFAIAMMKTNKQIKISGYYNKFQVGYLAHMRDPAGFAIELLGTTFEDNRIERAKLVRSRAGGKSWIQGLLAKVTYLHIRIAFCIDIYSWAGLYMSFSHTIIVHFY